MVLNNSTEKIVLLNGTEKLVHTKKWYFTIGTYMC